MHKNYVRLVIHQYSNYKMLIWYNIDISQLKAMYIADTDTDTDSGL